MMDPTIVYLHIYLFLNVHTLYIFVFIAYLKKIKLYILHIIATYFISILYMFSFLLTTLRKINCIGIL